jgi:hypothetical protein
LEELVTGQNHAWRAEATLQTVLFPETLLRRVEIAILGQPLNRGNLSTVSLNCQHRAGFDRRPIQHDCAGSTQARFTPNVRPGQAQHFTQVMYQEQSGFDVVLMGLSVNDGSKFHSIPPRRISLQTVLTPTPVTLADLL